MVTHLPSEEVHYKPSQLVLDIDQKIPLTCCISCVDNITGYAPEVNRTQMPQGKCRVNCVGGMLEWSDAEKQYEVHLFPKIKKTQVW